MPFRMKNPQAGTGRRRTLAIGASFGVITLIGSSNEQHRDRHFQRRRAVICSDGRRPDRVSYSTPELDAQRRDFTINGMFLDHSDYGDH